MKTIKWGIIGAGNISSTFATALNSMDNTKIAAIAARDVNRAQEFADRLHIEKAYGSYEELAKDPEIDVIYIGTPHTEHKANAALCIKNGKAVLCEKAFTINQQETQYLISLAKEHNVFLMEAMWTKFLPATEIVKHWVQEKKIGEVRHIKISFGFQAGFDINSRLFNPKLGGGALLDVGVYTISYVTQLLEKLPDKIVSSAILGKSNVDEQNAILFQYNEGILVEISSAICANLGDDAYIIGDKGSIHVPSFWKNQAAELYNSNGVMIESYSEPFDKNGYAYEAEEVNQCLREGKIESTVLPLKDTLNNMKIMDEVRTQWGLVYEQDLA